MNVRPFGDEHPKLGIRVWIDPAAVVIGRNQVPFVEAGLRALLKTFHAEMKVSMALTACTSVSDLTPDMLEPRGGD